jgi:hypothetical protein
LQLHKAYAVGSRHGNEHLTAIVDYHPCSGNSFRSEDRIEPDQAIAGRAYTLYPTRCPEVDSRAGGVEGDVLDPVRQCDRAFADTAFTQVELVCKICLVDEYEIASPR